MNHILEVDSVQLEFNGRKILSNIYVKCETDKITGLLGKNGQGKSCLMNIIYGTLASDKSIRFDHISIAQSFNRTDLLSYLPQFSFLPKSLKLHRIFYDFSLDYSEFQKIFPEFISRDKTSVNCLSRGERRLIELYIILKSASKFAMLDEPFTYLNPLQIEKVKNLLKAEKINKGIFITDHMYRHILEISDCVYVLTSGQTYLAKSFKDIEILGYTKF
jgi:ABC-type lipopolysaccharide export system ATPase subunit